ncbi:hypothetical protein LCGC14_0899820 [marine sediment metagenome]|uniref:Uncharacterized protein n=1 Tax=marine sediment metagenome TaxID=412755 RepID=A0A0F9PHI0_9ZZZZ
MSYKSRNVKILLIALGVLVIFGLGTLFEVNFSVNDGKRETVDNTNMIDGELNEFSLLRPSQSSTFLDDEAGISLYMDAGQALDLVLAKSGFKSIEKETSNYVVGSISLPNRPESDDVHGFVHIDGWIVVYYLKSEPFTKIIDWESYIGETLTKTKLQIGLEEICNVLFITLTNAKYYHFQYPNADMMMLIIETLYDPSNEYPAVYQDSFNLKILSELTIYERAWTHRAQLRDGSTTLTEVGLLTYAQLIPDIFHTVVAEIDRANIANCYSRLKIDNEIIHEFWESYYSDFSVSEVGIGIVYIKS